MTNKLTIELPDGVGEVRDHENAVFGNAKFIGLTIDTPEAADELIERVEEAKEKAARPTGMPAIKQNFWYMDGDGEKHMAVWDGDSCDLAYWEIGNVFLTEAECLAEIERRKALQRVRQWIADNTEPFEPDWGDVGDKASLVYSHAEGGFRKVLERSQQHLSLLPILRWQDAKRLIESCESDLRILAGL